MTREPQRTALTSQLDPVRAQPIHEPAVAHLSILIASGACLSRRRHSMLDDGRRRLDLELNNHALVHARLELFERALTERTHRVERELDLLDARRGRGRVRLARRCCRATHAERARGEARHVVGVRVYRQVLERRVAIECVVAERAQHAVLLRDVEEHEVVEAAYRRHLVQVVP